MAVIPRQSGMAEHLAATLPPNSLVAVDSWLMPLTTARTLESKLNPQRHKLVPLETSPIDDLWVIILFIYWYTSTNCLWRGNLDWGWWAHDVRMPGMGVRKRYVIGWEFCGKCNKIRQGKI